MWLALCDIIKFIETFPISCSIPFLQDFHLSGKWFEDKGYIMKDKKTHHGAVNKCWLEQQITYVYVAT